jgi:hypothetical protein
MKEYQAEKGMPQLMYRRAQPGHKINAFAPERLIQRFEGKLGDEVYQQAENKDTGEQGSHLAQSGQDEVFNEEEHGHIVCMISTLCVHVKGKYNQSNCLKVFYMISAGHDNMLLSKRYNGRY